MSWYAAGNGDMYTAQRIFWGILQNCKIRFTFCMMWSDLPSLLITTSTIYSERDGCNVHAAYK